MSFWRLVSSSSALFSDQFVQYMFKVVLRDLTCQIWVGFWHESCRYFQYLSREYLFANFGWIVWEIWICKDCCQFRCQNRWFSEKNLSKIVLGNLWSRICVGLQHERCRSIPYPSNEYSYVIFHGIKLKLWFFYCLLSIRHWVQTEHLFRENIQFCDVF
jgi:hypothetical protein